MIKTKCIICGEDFLDSETVLESNISLTFNGVVDMDIGSYNLCKKCHMMIGLFYEPPVIVREIQGLPKKQVG